MRTDFCWLIERGTAPAYWDGRGVSTQTLDAHDAVRFARREDAERMIGYLRDWSHGWEAVEHGFDVREKSDREALYAEELSEEAVRAIETARYPVRLRYSADPVSLRALGVKVETSRGEGGDVLRLTGHYPRRPASQEILRVWMEDDDG